MRWEFNDENLIGSPWQTDQSGQTLLRTAAEVVCFSLTAVSPADSPAPPPAMDVRLTIVRARDLAAMDLNGTTGVGGAHGH